ncbi:MAG: TIGR03936 family radical SAM-associated protein [Phycisphaerae bacterium]|nr:TIGR03936 family radical SAM-associated protein [Phycisphaerae bacterium]
MRYKVAIRFAIEGDLRFISHRDTMRLFERALARSRVPVKFSGGFNPKPRVSLPLPRSVGIASDADLAVFELSEPMDAQDVRQRLEPQMPEGLGLREAWPVASDGTVQPCEVEYSVDLSAESAIRAAAQAAALMAEHHWCIERDSNGGKAGRRIDLRALLVEVGVDGNTLHWKVRVDPKGGARPAEILTALGLDAASWLHRVRRTRVAWMDRDRLQSGASEPSSDEADRPLA